MEKMIARANLELDGEYYFHYYFIPVGGKALSFTHKSWALKAQGNKAPNFSPGCGILHDYILRGC